MMRMLSGHRLRDVLRWLHIWCSASKDHNEYQRSSLSSRGTLRPAALKASPVAALCSGENLAGTAITALLTCPVNMKSKGKLASR